MVNVWQLIAIVVTAAVLYAAIRYVLVPYFVLQAKRKASRTHMPQPEEIWMQDDQLLYIDSVNTTGVELMCLDAEKQQLHRWKDSWPEWQRRLEVRVLWYTGTRRPLGGS
jgi:hypothetical protein